MSDLHPRSRALIDLAKPAEEPRPADHARHRSGLARRLGAGAFAAGTTATTMKAAATVGLATTTTGLGIIGKTILALALVGAVGGGVYAVRASSRQVAPQVAVPPVLAPSAPPPVDVPPPAPEIAEPAHLHAAAQSSSASRKVSPIPTSKESTTGNIEEEFALVGEAQRALGNGNPARALELADRHAERFPKGQLSEERAGVRVLAGCALGRPDARAQAEKFLRTRATSPFARRVRAACGID